jgi:hypothetical protein
MAGIARCWSDVLRNPPVFGAIVVAVYFLAILPTLVYRNFDFSVFIVAGDRYVDATKVASPILIRPNSDGYDGQFYYRLAMAPFSLEQRAFGVAFDSPAWRTQRIAYPLIAWSLSLGRPAWAPVSLVFANLIGLAAIGFFASRLAARLRLGFQPALLVVLWPGFIISLMHDTTEIVAAAFLLGALDFYYAKRMLWFACLGALATLTRETSILALGGILLFELVQIWRHGLTRETVYRVVVCAASLTPYLIWRQAQQVIWGGLLTENAIRDLYWPLLGTFKALIDVFTNARLSTPGRHWFISTSFDAAGIMFLLTFIALNLRHIFVGQINNVAKPLIFGWLPILVLVMSLQPNAPLASPTEYFRAFSECFVIGSFVLFLQWNTQTLRNLVLAATTLLWIGACVQTSLTRPFL